MSKYFGEDTAQLLEMEERYPETSTPTASQTERAERTFKRHSLPSRTALASKIRRLTLPDESKFKPKGLPPQNTTPTSQNISHSTQQQPQPQITPPHQSPELEPVILRSPRHRIARQNQLAELQAQLAGKIAELAALKKNVQAIEHAHLASIDEMAATMHKEYSRRLSTAFRDLEDRLHREYGQRLLDLEQKVIQERQEKDELVKACDLYFRLHNE